MEMKGHFYISKWWPRLRCCKQNRNNAILLLSNALLLLEVSSLILIYHHCFFSISLTHSFLCEVTAHIEIILNLGGKKITKTEGIYETRLEIACLLHLRTSRRKECMPPEHKDTAPPDPIPIFPSSSTASCSYKASLSCSFHLRWNRANTNLWFAFIWAPQPGILAKDLQRDTKHYCILPSFSCLFPLFPLNVNIWWGF